MYKELLTLNYWLGPAYPETWVHDRNYFFIAVAMLLVAIGLWFFKKATKDKLQKNLLARWYRLLLTVSIFALIWSFLRYELVQYLSIRAIILVIYLWGLYLAIRLFQYMLTTYKKEQDQYLKEEIKNRYL